MMGNISDASVVLSWVRGRVVKQVKAVTKGIIPRKYPPLVPKFSYPGTDQAIQNIP